MDRTTFQNLTKTNIAEIVAEKGPIVCVFPFNGTRRWYMLEHGESAAVFGNSYMETITGRMAEICAMLFAHGIDTLLIPLLSPRLFESRGDRYTNMTLQALTLLCDHPQLKSLYESQQVRVRFYGDYVNTLSEAPFSHVLDQFSRLTDRTSHHDQHRIFWGINAHDATQTTTDLVIRYYQEHQQTPNKEALIKMYYGELIPPVNIFISAGKPRAFDMPLLSTGDEDLYYTVAPSPYLTQQQLRDILFDHIYARRKEQERYDLLEKVERDKMRTFYHENFHNTLGVGRNHRHWGIWYPISSTTLPEEPLNVQSEK